MPISLRVAAIAFAVATLFAGPAQAVTVRGLADYTLTTTGLGITLTLRNEIYRTLMAGHTPRAVCIAGNFSPDRVSPGMDAIGTALANAEETQSVEAIILDAVNATCTGFAHATEAELQEVDRRVDAQNLYSLLPDRLNIARVIDLALRFQAVRAESLGHHNYAQCLLVRLIAAKDANTPADGFDELFQEVYGNRATPVAVEPILFRITGKYCGDEPEPSVPAN